MRHTIFFIAVILAVFCFAGANAGKLELDPVANVVIQPPDSLDTDENGPRLLIEFDLPDSIVDQHIDYAAIVGSGNFPSYGGMSLIVLEVYPVITEWGESPDWFDPWRENGGDYDEDERNFYSIQVGDNRSAILDVTGLVTSWNSGTSDNYGVIVIPRKSNHDAYKSFSGNITILSNIKLIVHYSMPF